MPIRVHITALLMIKVDAILYALISVRRALVARGGQRLTAFENRAKGMLRPKREEAMREV
jgi:hypothetical protein